MSIKTERIGSLFTKEIGYILQNETKNKDFKFVTITGCDVTNDLSYAKVYITTLNNDKEKIIDSLNKASNFIELTLAKRIDIRKMPQISFHYDTSFEYGNNIDRIITIILNDILTRKITNRIDITFENIYINYMGCP